MRSGFAFLMIVSIIFCAPALAYDWATNPGDGSEANPYQVSEPNHLVAIGSDPNLLDKYFILTNDIIFDPNNNPEHVFDKALIAFDTDLNISKFQGTPFSGVFEGDTFQVINFKIETNLNSRGYYGLFGLINNGQVLNLGIQNLSISVGDNSSHIGGLVGSNDGGIINNCYSTGEITGGGWDFGGLLGSNKGGGIATKSYSRTNITCFDNYSDFLGGLVGYNDDGVINNCFSTGVITGGDRDIGGLIGRNYGDIYNSYSECVINGDDYSWEVGGLVGINIDGTIVNCHSVNSLFGYDSIGGLVGSNSSGKIINCNAITHIETSDNNSTSLGGLVGYVYKGTIQNSYSLGSIGEISDASYVGGLVGGNYSCDINNSYSQCSIDGNQYIGGLIGDLSNSTITNCYSTGNVSGNSEIGVFVGRNNSGMTVSGYYLDTAGPDNGYGTPLDDPNMMIQDNFVGWDFLGEDTNGENEIWRMCVDGVDYPRLSWEFAQSGDFACGDGTDILDLQALAEHWLMAESAAPAIFNYACDANGDGVINLTDYSSLAENW